MSAVFFAFDVETTGLDPANDQIISVAYRILAADLTVLSGDILYAWPEVPINAEAARINGYTEAKWTALKAITQAQLATALCAVLTPHKSLLPLGHNVKFDLAFLGALMSKHAEATTLKRSLSYHALDTVAATIFFDYVIWGKQHGSYSLSNLSKRFSLQHAAAHTADSDIDATIQLFHTLITSLKPENSEKLAALAATAAPEKWCRFFGKTDGDWKIFFGKHKGKKVDDVYATTPDYVLWMYNKLEDLSKEQRAYLHGKVAALLGQDASPEAALDAALASQGL